MRFNTRHLTAALSSSALGGLALLASWIGPQVIYTKIPTSPTSIVPGALDLAGARAVTQTSTAGRSWRCMRKDSRIRRRRRLRRTALPIARVPTAMPSRAMPASLTAQ